MMVNMHDSSEHQITVLTRALAAAQQQRDEAQKSLAQSITRRADLRHQVDVLTGRIAELEGESNSRRVGDAGSGSASERTEN